MRRVAIQLTSTGGFYGAERALVELAAFLAAQGWESLVVALEGQGAAELVRQANLRGIEAIAYADEARLGVFAIANRLRRTLSRFPRAIVHAHGYKPDILLAALRISKRLGCLATCHSWYSDTLKMKVAELLDKRLLRGFDHVVAVSDDIREDLIGNGLASYRVSRINNGISVPQLEPDARLDARMELGVAPDELLVVQIGRLAKSKRNDLLLQAVSGLPGHLQTKVLLVGDGDQRASLMMQARALGIADRVTLCGYRDDVPRILAAADVLALTSYKEGLPIILLEAMAIGCPIVSTAVGAVPAVLKDGESAWIVPINDLGAIRYALEESLVNQSEAQGRANLAKQAFLAGFSNEIMGRRYLSIYDRVWNDRGWC